MQHGLAYWNVCVKIGFRLEALRRLTKRIVMLATMVTMTTTTMKMRLKSRVPFSRERKQGNMWKSRTRAASFVDVRETHRLINFSKNVDITNTQKTLSFRGRSQMTSCIYLTPIPLIKLKVTLIICDFIICDNLIEQICGKIRDNSATAMKLWRMKDTGQNNEGFQICVLCHDGNSVQMKQMHKLFCLF